MVDRTRSLLLLDDCIGYSVKREMGELLDEKLEDTAFYNEWTGGAMSASRVRILTTEFLGEAWERVQARVDIGEIFKKKGWGFVVSDENDKCVRMPQLEGYSWYMADLDDVVEAPDDDDDDAPEELATAEEEHDSGDERDEGNESSDGEEEEVDPGPWQDTHVSSKMMCQNEASPEGSSAPPVTKMEDLTATAAQKNMNSH